MNFNILRTTKIKSRGKITQCATHNFRLRHQKNIDKTRSHLNKTLMNSLNTDITKPSDLQEKLTAYYLSLGIKEKSDNVLMMEFVVSASPGFFIGKKPSDVEAWANHQVGFMKKEFGDQLKIGVLHLDEKTPHLHFMIGTEIKSLKRYKNQKGEFHKETWSLNAKRYDPEFLVKLHDRHAEWNCKYNLNRGERNSFARHTSLKDFYRQAEKAMNTSYEQSLNKVKEILSSNLSLLNTRFNVEKLFDEIVKPEWERSLKSNKALKALLAGRYDEHRFLEKKRKELVGELENTKQQMNDANKLKEKYEASLQNHKIILVNATTPDSALKAENELLYIQIEKLKEDKERADRLQARLDEIEKNESKRIMRNNSSKD